MARVRARNGEKMRKAIASTLAGVAIGAGFGLAPSAQALPPGCQQVPWGFLGTQVRQICDGPVLPDGSWMRHRVEGYPEHYAYPSSSCSSGSYSSYCTYYPGGDVAERDTDNETYPVRVDTVLPDEPGHLG
jgi:hypothetical protein